MPNVIIDKKGQSDDDDDEPGVDEKTGAAEEDFLGGRGDESREQILQQAVPTDEVNGDGPGSDDHGKLTYDTIQDAILTCARKPT